MLLDYNRTITQRSEQKGNPKRIPLVLTVHPKITMVRLIITTAFRNLCCEDLIQILCVCNFHLYDGKLQVRDRLRDIKQNICPVILVVLF